MEGDASKQRILHIAVEGHQSGIGISCFPGEHKAGAAVLVEYYRDGAGVFPCKVKLIVDPLRLVVLRVRGDLSDVAPGEVAFLQGEGQRHLPIRHFRQVKIDCAACLFLALSSLAVRAGKLDAAVKGTHRLGAVQGVLPTPADHHIAVQQEVHLTGELLHRGIIGQGDLRHQRRGVLGVVHPEVILGVPRLAEHCLEGGQDAGGQVRHLIQHPVVIGLSSQGQGDGQHGLLPLLLLAHRQRGRPKGQFPVQRFQCHAGQVVGPPGDGQLQLVGALQLAGGFIPHEVGGSDGDGPAAGLGHGIEEGVALAGGFHLLWGQCLIVVHRDGHVLGDLHGVIEGSHDGHILPGVVGARRGGERDGGLLGGLLHVVGCAIFEVWIKSE